MTQTSVYVFNSQTANEAADAVSSGEYESIIQYHVNKYMQQQGPVTQHPLPPAQQQQKQIQQNHYVMQRPALSGQQNHQQLPLGPSPHPQMHLGMNNGPPPPQMQQQPPVPYQGLPQQNPQHGQWINHHEGLEHPQSPHQHMGQIKYESTMNNQMPPNHVGPPAARPNLQQAQPNFESNLTSQPKKDSKLNNNGQPPPQMQQQGSMTQHPLPPAQQQQKQIQQNHYVMQRPALSGQQNHQQLPLGPSPHSQMHLGMNNGPPPPQMQQQPPVPYQGLPQQNPQHGQWMNHHGGLEHPQSPHQHMGQIKYESTMNNQMPPNHVGPQTTRPNLQQAQPNFESNLTPQQKKDRESKLNKLGHLAQITLNHPAQCGPMQTNMTQHQMSQPQHQLQAQHQIMSQPQQHLQPPSSQPSLNMKQEHQELDPLSSMAAMSESPNIYGHTIHHHPRGQQHPPN